MENLYTVLSYGVLCYDKYKEGELSLTETTNIKNKMPNIPVFMLLKKGQLSRVYYEAISGIPIILHEKETIYRKIKSPVFILEKEFPISKFNLKRDLELLNEYEKLDFYKYSKTCLEFYKYAKEQLELHNKNIMKLPERIDLNEGISLVYKIKNYNSNDFE